MSFAERLLAWYDLHGRKDLPWQQAPTPYRVWISEIMLQQTQVATVIPYYQRFMARFPDLAGLAAAPLDEVLALWSGLGYYSRARNIHRSAGILQHELGGELPLERSALMALPGIGRSTAGAILALALGQREAILDGNVRRVLCRYHAIEGWPGLASITKRLWLKAERHTPDARVADYTQAIMDLGATVCTRARPRCGECPQNAACQAHAQGRTADIPTPAPRKTLPQCSATLLLVQNERGEILLERRPPSGIWGGLWSLPELGELPLAQWCQARDLDFWAAQSWPSLHHSFSHFQLEIRPLHLQVSCLGCRAMEDRPVLWYKPKSDEQPGLPAPVKTLLAQLANL